MTYHFESPQEELMANIRKVNKHLFRQLGRAVELHIANGISAEVISEAMLIKKELIQTAIHAYLYGKPVLMDIYYEDGRSRNSVKHLKNYKAKSL